MYARDGKDLHVIPGQPDRRVWWRNLRHSTRARLPLHGRDLTGTATAAAKNLPTNRPVVAGPNDPDRSLLVG